VIYLETSNNISILAVTTLAIAVSEGHDSKHVKLLSSYFYLIGSVLGTIAAAREIEEAKASSSCQAIVKK